MQSSGLGMSQFELSDAIDLFSREKAAINSLWTTHVVGNFAAAAYGFSGQATLNAYTATAVSIGFSAFAFGNWKLLKQSLVISKTLQKEIRNMASLDPSNKFSLSVEALVKRANPPWISMLIHLFIDLCVLTAIWTRVFAIAH
jgi:hypothetical protein